MQGGFCRKDHRERKQGGRVNRARDAKMALEALFKKK
jgi:hypothetical protein